MTAHGGQQSDSHPGYHFTPFQQVKSAEARAKLKYELLIRQEPKQSRMCGIGEKADRRPIDPPPIVQLKIEGMETEHGDGGKVRNSMAWLQNPCYFMYASLIIGDKTASSYHFLSDGKTRSTTGSVVSNMYKLRDLENSKEGGFFIFPDLSVRAEGHYQLKLSLLEIVGAEVHHCASIYSGTFQVYTAKKFPGMEESTTLSRYFAEQGLKIRIRRESRVRPASSTETSAKKHARIRSEDERSRLDSPSAMTSGVASAEKPKGGKGLLSTAPKSKDKGSRATMGNTGGVTGPQGIGRPRHQAASESGSYPSVNNPMSASQIPSGLSWDDVWSHSLRPPTRGAGRALPPLGQGTPTGSSLPSQPMQSYPSHHNPTHTNTVPQTSSARLPSHTPDFSPENYRYEQGMPSMAQPSKPAKDFATNPNEASSLLAYLAASSKPDFSPQMDPSNFMPPEEPTGPSSSYPGYQGLRQMKQYTDGTIDPDRGFAFDKGMSVSPMAKAASPVNHTHHHHYHGVLPISGSPYPQPPYYHYAQPLPQPQQPSPYPGGPSQYDQNEAINHLHYESSRTQPPMSQQQPLQSHRMQQQQYQQPYSTPLPPQQHQRQQPQQQQTGSPRRRWPSNMSQNQNESAHR